MIGQIIFGVLCLGTFFIGFKKFSKIRRNIFLGKDVQIEGDAAERWKNTFLIAFGQQKMFQRPLVAVLHLFIYAAFMITQLELIEIFIDGLTGSHRILFPLFGALYTFAISFIEILSVLALVATFVFLSRRNLIKLPRFWSAEMTSFPRLDANLILLLEILLVTFIFMMNTADMVLHRGEYGFAVSGLLMPVFQSLEYEHGLLHTISSIGWWGHILVVFAFLLYIPHSKHLHIILAFFNTYYARLTPRGELENMPTIQKEVASMFADTPPSGDMEPLPTKFAANDVTDLAWTQVLSAYTCTECGRCTSVCPANLTGKKLSPRKIMMDIRDRAEEIGNNIDANRTEFISEDKKTETSILTKENYNDGKNLFDYISVEELHACTSCNACVEACPVMINPLDIIVEMRRYLILDVANSPDAWNNMFTNIENNGAPWQFSRSDRANWINELTD